MRPLSADDDRDWGRGEDVRQKAQGGGELNNKSNKAKEEE